MKRHAKENELDVKSRKETVTQERTLKTHTYTTTIDFVTALHTQHGSIVINASAETKANIEFKLGICISNALVSAYTLLRNDCICVRLMKSETKVE